jgi:hypothetical protein
MGNSRRTPLEITEMEAIDGEVELILLETLR